MIAEHRHRTVLGLTEEAGYLGIDRGLGLLGERTAGEGAASASEEDRATGRVAHRPDCIRQAELTDHLGGELGGFRQVVGSTGRALSEDDELARAPPRVTVSVS